MFHSAAPTPDEGHLTYRESEVLDLIARGMSNVEIAEATSLSINAIKSFIRSAYRKIGVEKREHAIAWAVDRGYGQAAPA
ncbi:MAG: helix-turn-helix transcriptional regulator [Herbiconiux sp.]|nr:helix-turn-helix transcriptional regulator [Herbiconiux sp.]